MALTTTGFRGAMSSMKSAIAEDNVLDVLRKQHDSSKKLFRDLLEDKAMVRSSAWKDLRANLRAHSIAEDEVLYKKMLKYGPQEVVAFLKHSQQDHDDIERLVDELERTRCADAKAMHDPKWLESVRVLEQMVLKHIWDEETKGFEMIRAIFDEAKMEKYGGKLSSKFLRHVTSE
eukprot:TRINITY_DN8355_c0_g1_i1.p1 TRINITY_DN8355_c0_g1~~TRINITY_DN8355_c0_g1_i1.p1  ORF type:complete len:175 (-),score=44.94 TRINITY_DN8355_c0_g1_i1:25-549(-)